jgi:thioredoxin-dependent peroxiredoxin
MADQLKVGADAREILKQAGVDQFVGRKNVVLYFYPRDFTPGCTQEAQDFRDAKAQFDALNTEIVGVSADSGESHDKFAGRYELNFTLVSDPKQVLGGQCGTKGVLGMESRTTYLIDKEGKVRFIWPKVKVGGHADDVLAKVKELGLA